MCTVRLMAPLTLQHTMTAARCFSSCWTGQSLYHFAATYITYPCISGSRACTPRNLRLSMSCLCVTCYYAAAHTPRQKGLYKCRTYIRGCASLKQVPCSNLCVNARPLSASSRPSWPSAPRPHRPHRRCLDRPCQPCRLFLPKRIMPLLARRRHRR